MGNWRTVRIVGTCDAEDLDALRDAIQVGPQLQRMHCLSSGSGMCGLGDWPSTDIDVTGNLFERDYDVQDVADTLEKLVQVAPSLDIVVHCGGDYESTAVENTIVVSLGRVSIEDPQVETTGSISETEMGSKFMASLFSRRRR